MPTLYTTHLQLAAADLQAGPEQARLPGRGGAAPGVQRAAQRRPGPGQPQPGQRRGRGLAADGARQRGTGGTLLGPSPCWKRPLPSYSYLDPLKILKILIW